jgi:ATP-dependent helicase/nuclease subunit A
MTSAAYEHNGRRVSRERFYAIACDPRRSVAVEACAGAGKTWMLVSRMVRALLDGARPHEILAITFTKKAAGEMRQRLHDWLAEWSQASPQALDDALAMRGLPGAGPQLREALRELYAQLLRAGRPVQIRTFHSWFAALLRSAPLAVLQQLGLPTRYELLEDDSEAIARVWRRFHVAVAREPQAKRDYEASVAAYGRFQTLKALEAALAKRVEFQMADVHGVVEASVQHFHQPFPQFAQAADPGHTLALPRVRGLLADAARALGRASAPTFAAKGGELEMALTSGDLQGVLDALLTQKQEPRKFSEKLAGIDTVRQAQELAQELAAARLQHEAWLHHQRMARLGRQLVAEFGALKREQGWVDMSDVERAALVLLSDPVLSGWVQERLDMQVRHLLIDEFQDTNPLQWQALNAWMSGYSGAGGDAPSVFIVGDPKQSIYRFRRAEPQVFTAAQEFIVQGLGGDRLSCDHTHRNAPELLAVVNQVLEAAQAQGEYQGFRAHSTESTLAGSVCALPPIAREAQQAGAPAQEDTGWRDSLTQPRELPEEKLIALECRQAAAWIAAQLASGTAPGDIMVLARKRDRLAAMEEELRERHIPAQQPEKADLCEAPEVRDIAALLDALVSPSHDLSLAQALKSPLFGVDDRALVQLALRAREAQRAGQAYSWFELLQQPDSLCEALRAAGQALQRWKQWLEQLPPHDALQAIYQDGDVLARFARCAPAPLRAGTLANLQALLGAALQVRGGRYLTPYAFVRALKAGGIPGPAVAAAGVVRLLTVHGAKGLEAPTVVLLDTDGAPARPETMGVICEWPGEAPAPWRFAFLASESRPPACSAEALAVEQAARQREELNALYVAMTRARRQLVVSSVQPANGNGASWWSRLLPWCTPLEGPPPESGLPQQLDVHAEILLPVLPTVRLERAAPAPATPDSAESRFGQAVHRLLELAQPQAAPFAPSRLARIAREFGLDDPAAHQAAAMARRILDGEGAWAWDAQAVDWHGNEVELAHEGELLRLDRLVRRRDSGEWWVLDYKSAGAPERQPQLLAQMRRYCEAVRRAYPGAQVRAAFLTGQGRLVAL